MSRSSSIAKIKWQEVQDEVNLYAFLNERGIRAPEALLANLGHKVVVLKIGRAYYIIGCVRKTCTRSRLVN
jgi:hypothetical protein